MKFQIPTSWLSVCFESQKLIFSILFELNCKKEKNSSQKLSLTMHLPLFVPENRQGQKHAWQSGLRGEQYENVYHINLFHAISHASTVRTTKTRFNVIVGVPAPRHEKNIHRYLSHAVASIKSLPVLADPMKHSSLPQDRHKICPL